MIAALTHVATIAQSSFSTNCAGTFKLLHSGSIVSEALFDSTNTIIIADTSKAKTIAVRRQAEVKHVIIRLLLWL